MIKEKSILHQRLINAFPNFSPDLEKNKKTNR